MGIFYVTVKVFALCMLQLSIMAELPYPSCIAVAAENGIENITTPFSLYGPSVLLTPTHNTFWMSPANVFAWGFLQTPSSSVNPSASTSFTLSLFYSSLSQFELIPVWTPHRGRLLSQNATLSLTAQGDLVLSDSGQQIWRVNATGATTILVSDQGYVSLLGKNSSTVWKSWDEPITDTLLPGQDLMPDEDMVDAKGRFLLKLQLDSNLVLYSLASQSYFANWATNTLVLNVTHAYYNASQGLLLIDKKGQTVSTVLQTSMPTKLERIVLTESGTLTRYKLSADGKSWIAAAQVPSSTCHVFGLCGPYGICVEDQQSSTDTNGMDNYKCRCPDGFYYIDANDWLAGCGTNYPLDCDKGNRLTRLSGVLYNTNNYSSGPSNLDQCVQSCNSSCECAAATYDGQNCVLRHVGQVYNGVDLQDGSVTYLKISVYPADNSTHTYTPAQVIVEEARIKRVISVGAAVGIGVAAGLLCLVGSAYLAVWYQYRSRPAGMSQVADAEGHENESPLLGGGPIQFSHKQLKEASNGFKSLLGRGGFGPVYKGVLAGGTPVAIKKLDGSSYGGEKQFRAEVMTIGSVHHMNLVRLRGYCAEGPHKLLVYEFMPRGSLNRYIFSDNQSTSSFDDQAGELFFLDWKTRFQIVLSTARAIRYLHEECQPLIVHCDIKPANILLGEAFNAKVSDFGTAQPVGGEAGLTASITRIRGTVGYMAPEWASCRFITTKLDVYSFGIVVLEVISGRHAMDMEAASESKVFLASWAYSKVMQNHAAHEILDPRLRVQVASQHAISPLSTISTHDSQMVSTDEEGAASSVGEMERAVLVALWCIHKDPSKRPSMGQVVQWLEGIMPVDLPPYPF